MTYSWEEVREEACELYKAGTTLKDIQTKFSHEKNFTAGTRVWRKRLVDWDARRRIIPQKRPRTSQAPHDSRTEAVERTVRNDVSIVSHAPGRISRRPNRTLNTGLSSRLETIQNTQLLFGLGSNVDGSPMQIDPALPRIRQSDLIDQETESLNLVDSSMPAAQREEFAPNLISQDNNTAGKYAKEAIDLTSSLDESQDTGPPDHNFEPPADQNIQSRGDRFETGILKYPVSWLEEFMRYEKKNISVNEFRSFFAFCLRSLAGEEKLKILLHHWEEQHGSSTSEAIDIIAGFLEACNEQSYATYHWKIVEHLLQRSRRLHSLTPVSLALYQTFLNPCKFYDHDRVIRRLALECLRRFLLAGLFPPSRFHVDNPHCLHQSSCDSPAKAATRHGEAFTTYQSIVESFNIDRHGEEFVSFLIDAYKTLDVSIDDSNLLKSFGILLMRYRSYYGTAGDVMMLNIVLTKFPSAYAEKMIKLVRLILDCNIFRTDETELKHFAKKSLHLLTTVPSPLRLHVAELVLARIFHAGGDFFSYSILDDHMAYMGPHYLSRLRQYTTNPHELRQCVVHVVSKKMIRWAGSDITIVREALILRKAAGLPWDYVAVRGDVLLLLLESANLLALARLKSIENLMPWVRYPKVGKLDKGDKILDQIDG